MMKRKGLTMMELLIVIIIMAIMATLMLPKFFGQEERGYVAEAVGILSAIRQGEEAHKLEHTDYVYTSGGALDWASLGMDSPTGVFSYTVTRVGTTTTFTAVANRQGGGAFAGQTITLTSSGVYSGTHIYKPK
ncbi:MAG: prepilin-type N-terminal cleavage/methylation domain-containing protein [Candidatus Omnitrophota bacterium]